MAAVAASLLAMTAAVSPGGALASATARGGDTPLPPGWELCVLAGLSAPATQANIADLDEWQTAEGGSTDNSAAYNPFNTRRTTNALGAALPVTSAVGGFPAFPDWLTGCAATVATLLQPPMWAISAALRAGNVAPPGQFLLVVDGTTWCAPSAPGQPCYENAIAASGGSIPAIVASSALNVYGNVQSDLRAYQTASLATVLDQHAQATRSLDVAKEQDGVVVARAATTQAHDALESFAIAEYVHSGLYQANYLAVDASSQTQGGVAAQEYTKIAGSDVVARAQAATAALTAARRRLEDAQRGLQSAAAAVLADSAAANHALDKLIADLATLQTAGACTTVSLVAQPSAAPNSSSSGPAPAAGVAPGDGGTGNTATTGDTGAGAGAAPTTTSTTLQVQASAVPTQPTTSTPSSSSTTTTTSAPAITTTSTTSPGPARGNPSTSTTTSTSTPASTSTSGSAPTTAAVRPAGMGALQGCVSALAPRSSV